jgi:hypothetical protein
MAEFLSWFDPLYAKRDVGAPTDVDLKEFELDKDNGTLVLKGGDKTLIELQLGKRGYGSTNYYVLDKGKNRVLLISGAEIENFEKANNRMLEVRLSDIDFADISKVELQVGENTKTIAHTQRNGAGQLIWTVPGQEEEKAAYKNLFTKIEKLRVKSYGSLEERQAMGAQIPFAELRMYKGDKEIGSYRFAKDANKETRYWTWSSFVGAYAEIDKAQAESLEKDIPGVVLE